MDKNKKVIVALDLNNFDEIITLIDKIKKYIFGVKIGYEFFFNFGLDGYKIIKNKKINIFLDFKLHDIPNTIKNSIYAISSLKPYFTTVHISGGDNMLQAANTNKLDTKILGVSVLTSLDDKQIKKYYSKKNIKELVTDYTYYAIENKLDGVVCSPHEIKIIKNISKDKLIIVTPGIRPKSYNLEDDQKRYMSPGEASYLGADYLVIGRPITKSKDPVNQLIETNSEIEKYQN